MKRLLAPALGLAIALAAAAGSVRAETVADAHGQPVAAVTEGGIVTVGAVVTEIAYALGAGDRVIAVDTTSRYPEAATALPNVGYMRTLAAEPIIALEPALVLAQQESGPEPVLDQISAAGVPVVRVPDEPTLGGVVHTIAVVGAALGRAAEAAALADRLEAELDGQQRALAGVAERPSVLFALSIGAGPPLSAGRGTTVAGLIALAGGRNATDGFDDYKPLSPEAAVEAAPDVILLTQRTLDALGGEDALLARPEFATSPAARDHRVVVMESGLLLGFGPRTGTAIRQLAAVLHPEVTLPAPPR